MVNTKAGVSELSREACENERASINRDSAYVTVIRARDGVESRGVVSSSVKEDRKVLVAKRRDWAHEK